MLSELSPFSFPLLIEGRIVPHELIVEVHEDLHRASGAVESVRLFVPDFVVEHHFSALGGPVGDVHPRLAAVEYGLPVLDREVNYRGIIPVVNISLITEPSFV